MQQITDTKITIKTAPTVKSTDKTKIKKTKRKKDDDKGLICYDSKLKFLTFDSGATQSDYNIFFSMISQFKETNNNDIFMDYETIQKLIIADNFTYDDIFVFIKNAVEKIIRCILRVEDERFIQFFPMFEKIEIPKNIAKNQPYIKARISPAFSDFIHRLQFGFNLVELYAFCNLKSKYSQTLFYLLQPFSNVGKVSLTWERFIKIMDLPEHFDIHNIDEVILKPAIQELSQITLKNNDNNQFIFKNLTYQKLNTKDEADAITDIEFSFDVNVNLIQQKSNSNNVNNNTIIEGQIADNDPKIQAQTISQIVEYLQQYVGQVLKVKNGLLSVITKIYQGLEIIDGDNRPKYGIKVDQQTVNENKVITTFYDSKVSFEKWYNQYKFN